MSCDVVTTPLQQVACSDTPTPTPCIITVSKMDISNTLSRKTVGLSKSSRNTFIDSMEKVPTCSLLKSSVAICVYLFGHMFIGKNKNPLYPHSYTNGPKALQYFRNIKLSAGDNAGLKCEEVNDENGKPIEKQTSFEHRRGLIERAEQKLQQLMSLHRDSWDMYRLLMIDNLEESPFKDNVKKIQILLTRVTKFVTFAHGKLDTLKTCTLIELIEILEELECILQLTSNMQLAQGDHSVGILNNTRFKIDKGKLSERNMEENLLTAINKTCNAERIEANHRVLLPENRNGSGDETSETKINSPKISDQSQATTENSDVSSLSVQTVINKLSENPLSTGVNNVNCVSIRQHNQNKVESGGDGEKRSVQELSQNQIHIEKSLRDEINDVEKTVKLMSRQIKRCQVTSEIGFKKQRSIYAGMKHSISRFVPSADIEQRVKSTISHIGALGQVDTKIDKNRLEKIFGKIGRTEGETNIRKPTKTKLEQITREFVKIKDTIIRLIRINRGAKQVESNQGGGGDVQTANTVKSISEDMCISIIGNSQEDMTKYENKLEQLNKKLEEIRTAYNLLRTISINTLSHRSKKEEVRKLMTDLSIITQQLSRLQPPLENKHQEKNVFPIISNSSNGIQNNLHEGNNRSLLKENCDKTKINVATDTSRTAGKIWPTPRYQSVLYNFEWDEQSNSLVQEISEQQSSSETKENTDTTVTNLEIPGDKGTQTRLDTISSRIEKNKTGDVVHENSCIVTLGQPLRKTRSVNIINQESRKIATLKLLCQSSESIVTSSKTKQNENCRNRFKELMRVGKGFFERSCKKNTDKIEVSELKNPDCSGQRNSDCSKGSVRQEILSEFFNNNKMVCTSTDKSESSNQKNANASKTENNTNEKKEINAKDKLAMKNAQTSYDSFLIKQDIMTVQATPSLKSNYTCVESDNKVKEAVENALAGIESAYSLALREFIARLNTQGISIRLDCSSRSTSTTGLHITRKLIARSSSYKYSRMESKISMYSFNLKEKQINANEHIDYTSQISVDTISFVSTNSCSRKLSKRVPYPMSRTRIVESNESNRLDTRIDDNSLDDYISSFEKSFHKNSSILLIQNNNFK